MNALVPFVLMLTAAPLPKGLAERLEPLIARAGKTAVGVAVVHVESGAAFAAGQPQPMPLHSVFKLPLAFAVLEDVAAGRLALDKAVRVEKKDLLPGAAENTERWQNVPADFPLRELLRRLLVYSDNTSADKLLGMVGGASQLTKRLKAHGVDGIDIRASVREFRDSRFHANRATAMAFAQFLVRLQKGELLPAPQNQLLFDLMVHCESGVHRLRANLPPGTIAADRTGTGNDGATTNDVGVITLPGNGGHLAIAVFITGSKQPFKEQEEIIASIGRAAFDAFAETPATK